MEIQKNYQVNENVTIRIIDIKKMTPKLSQLIDKYLVKICEGCVSQGDIKIVKKRINSFLASKNETTQMGAIAEFFIHLDLNSQKYKQECLFLNLEENSIKKGFDGYYSKDGEEWIMESKSGSSKTQGISHSSKILEAYNDLKNKFEGKVSNNPWQNAYNHASHIDVATDMDIRKHIKNISEDFTRNKYCKIDEFNIIPGATIFLDGEWVTNNIESMSKKLEKTIKKFNYKKIIIICITKKSLNLFKSYLNLEETNA